MSFEARTRSGDAVLKWKFGSKLKLARESRHLTYYQLAELSGCTEGQIMSYENDRQQPSLHTVRALCKALRVSADILLGLL